MPDTLAAWVLMIVLYSPTDPAKIETIQLHPVFTSYSRCLAAAARIPQRPNGRGPQAWCIAR